MKTAAQSQYDVVVIGAGINGAGIARDAAMRGLRVAIFDKNDLCSGTSGYSSRLIHGGLRYLEYGEIPLVYESLHERRYLRKIAPHLVRPLRINIPIYENAKRGPWLVRLGMLAYDILSWNKKMPRHDMLSAQELTAEAPGLQAESLLAGARYYDAQVTYAERLVVENLLAAQAAGAEIRLWHGITGLDVIDGQVRAVHWRDELGENGGTVTANAIVNAAGPWVDQVLGLTGTGAERRIGGTKGSHIVVGQFDGAPAEAFYVEAAADGRPFFIIPWNNQVLIGTTDIRSDEALESLRASDEEVDYLLAETNRVFPSANLGRDDIHFAYAGMRPLPFKKDGPESAITRRHIIVRDDKRAANLFSIIGGKLTTYRNLAEQTVDAVSRYLRRKSSACRTHDTPLPGGARIEDVAKVLQQYPELDHCRERLLAVYGQRAEKLLQFALNGDGLDRLGEEGLAAEVAFAIEHEFARTLVDIVFRRTMLGFAQHQGRPVYEQVAQLAAAAAGWTEERHSEELRLLLAHADSLRVTT